MYSLKNKRIFAILLLVATWSGCFPADRANRQFRKNDAGVGGNRGFGGTSDVMSGGANSTDGLARGGAAEFAGGRGAGGTVAAAGEQSEGGNSGDRGSAQDGGAGGGAGQGSVEAGGKGGGGANDGGAGVHDGSEGGVPCVLDVSILGCRLK
ncbi:MAG: hypothetical protein ACOY0T_31325 [Myxococcota bacterium]